jgi:hypothetical protein
MTTLGQLAQLIRSKNAGPFWMTIDAFFASTADFNRAAASPLTDPLVISGLYGVPADTVQVFLLDQLNAIKISLPRPVVQGAVNDADLHAGQQYVPLLPIEIQPESPS